MTNQCSIKFSSLYSFTGFILPIFCTLQALEESPEEQVQQTEPDNCFSDFDCEGSFLNDFSDIDSSDNEVTNFFFLFLFRWSF